MHRAPREPRDRRGGAARALPLALVVAAGISAFVLLRERAADGAADGPTPAGPATAGERAAPSAGAVAGVTESTGTARVAAATPEPAGAEEAGTPDAQVRAAWDSGLASLYDNPRPDLGTLRAVVEQLGADAQLVPGSVAEGPGPDRWRARVRFPALGVEGAVTVGDSTLELILDEGFGGREYDRRRVTIDLALANGTIGAGGIAVHHALDREDEEVVDAVLEEPRTVGWRLDVDLEGGSTATPLLAVAVEDDEGDPVLVDGAPGDADFEGYDLPPSASEPGAFDLSPWAAWIDLQADVRARAAERD